MLLLSVNSLLMQEENTLKKYFYRRPSMAEFVELMNTKSVCERYRLMLFVNIVLNEYENINEQR